MVMDMTRENEIQLAQIFINCLERMGNSDADWRKVRDAFSRACGTDPEMCKRAVQYAGILEEVVK